MERPGRVQGREPEEGARGEDPEHYERDPDPETVSFRKQQACVKHVVPSSFFFLISGSGSLLDSAQIPKNAVMLRVA